MKEIWIIEEQTNYLLIFCNTNTASALISGLVNHNLVFKILTVGYTREE